MGYADNSLVVNNPFLLNYLGNEREEDFFYKYRGVKFLIGIGDNIIREKIYNLIIEKEREIEELAAEYLPVKVKPFEFKLSSEIENPIQELTTIIQQKRIIGKEGNPKSTAERTFVIALEYEKNKESNKDTGNLAELRKLLGDQFGKLNEENSLMMVGAGKNGKEPLVFQDGGKTYRAFLEGRVKDNTYVLLLHLSNLELKGI